MVFTTYALTQAQNGAASDFYSAITHIGVGTDTTAPVIGDTALGAETFRGSLFNQNLSNNVVTKDLRLDETQNNGYNVAEIGQFDASSSGNMYNRRLPTSTAKTSAKVFFYRLKSTFVAENA